MQALKLGNHIPIGHLKKQAEMAPLRVEEQEMHGNMEFKIKPQTNFFILGAPTKVVQIRQKKNDWLDQTMQNKTC